MTGEERVLSLQGDGADCAFHGVAVHFDASISEEQDQAIPVFGDVFEGSSGWRFGGDLAACLIQPCFKGIDLGCRLLLPDGQAFLG